MQKKDRSNRSYNRYTSVSVSIHYIQLWKTRSAVYLWQTPKCYVKYTFIRLRQVCEVGRMVQKYTAGSVWAWGGGLEVEWQVEMEELEQHVTELYKNPAAVAQKEGEGTQRRTEKLLRRHTNAVHVKGARLLPAAASSTCGGRWG